ncbi:hypothetical protein EVAR_48438_1 [Eumeta japonica]|uniref:Uncharacterized protein n=1 Tax=Eumeta variegata TaxID=151549 RepID=A0A4C1XU88_EUMVA|nr:hypothetical protein EVAR_48438_1 [Eumeta japonica]
MRTRCGGQRSSASSATRPPPRPAPPRPAAVTRLSPYKTQSASVKYTCRAGRAPAQLPLRSPGSARIRTNHRLLTEFVAGRFALNVSTKLNVDSDRVALTVSFDGDNSRYPIGYVWNKE